MPESRLFPRLLLVSLLSLGSTLALHAQEDAGTDVGTPEEPETAGTGIQWRNLLTQSVGFLALEHGFRYASDPGVRGSHLPFVRGYAESVSNLHGWADGDPFFVNYVGHPIQGAIAGFIFVQNDPKYKDALFGRNRRYWKSRLRAAAFAWAYSEEFEIGPISEASIGHTQAYYPQQGFVDQVITPSVGMGWMIAEDAVDRIVITSIETHSQSRFVRIVARGVLNPTRTMANVLAGRVPWYREGRSLGMSRYEISAIEPREEGRRRFPQVPAFQFMTAFRVQQVPGLGAKGSCAGGSGVAEFRLRGGWELVGDVGGCKIMAAPAPAGQTVSGDSLTFMVGPRRVWRQTRRWQPYAQVLAGGRKLTWESVYIAKRTAVEESGKSNPAGQSLYTQTFDMVSPAIMASAGLDFRATSAVGIRVGELGYSKAWHSQFDGLDYSNNVEVTAGLTLRLGTW